MNSRKEFIKDLKLGLMKLNATERAGFRSATQFVACYAAATQHRGFKISLKDWAGLWWRFRTSDESKDVAVLMDITAAGMSSSGHFGPVPWTLEEIRLNSDQFFAYAAEGRLYDDPDVKNLIWRQEIIMLQAMDILDTTRSPEQIADIVGSAALQTILTALFPNQMANPSQLSIALYKIKMWEIPWIDIVLGKEGIYETRDLMDTISLFMMTHSDDMVYQAPPLEIVEEEADEDGRFVTLDMWDSKTQQIKQVTYAVTEEEYTAIAQGGPAQHEAIAEILRREHFNEAVPEGFPTEREVEKLTEDEYLDLVLGLPSKKESEPSKTLTDSSGGAELDVESIQAARRLMREMEGE